ncbi:MAG: hypothetical protein II124_07625 [Clostridia bacterium]|nr:hypothetical protein [Clostridia bacterium]MBQ2517219.1 hypothetical protein [Clostridia bacterium]MBR6429493.1 hypothetical protein [Clostridia bacterium]
MLTVEKLIEKLKLDVIELPDPGREITGGYAGDLLSWVMGRAQEGDAWVTIMTNMNVAAVAQLTDVACVVFAEGVVPDKEAVLKARQHGINLVGSRKGVFELCGEIKDSMLSAAEAGGEYEEAEV